MPAITFRSRFTIVLCMVSWASLAVVMIIVLITPGGLERGLIPLGLLAVAAIVWAVLWSPYVRVDDDAVTVANIFREIRIPWPALIEVDTRFSLTLRTPHRVVSATAAPAPGRQTGLGAARIHRSRTNSTGSLIRPGDLPSSDSGQAAELVRERWHRLRDSGRIQAGVAHSTPVHVRLRGRAIAAVGIATLVLIVGAILG